MWASIWNWSASFQPEIEPLFTISFQCLKKTIFQNWQVYNWLAKWLIMSGYMDLSRPRVYRRSNVGLVCLAYSLTDIDFWWCNSTSMALCKTAVSPLLTHWRYCSVALSNWQHVSHPCEHSHITATNFKERNSSLGFRRTLPDHCLIFYYTLSTYPTLDESRSQA